MQIGEDFLDMARLRGAEKDDSIPVIHGITIYDYFSTMSECSSIVECKIKSDILGLPLPDTMLDILEKFIQLPIEQKKMKLAMFSVMCYG